MYYLYKIENLINHKIYIGLTNNPARRKYQHFYKLRKNEHDNNFLQKEFNIYKEDNFSFEIVYSEDCDEEKISNKEVEFIKKYDSYYNGYNQNTGGNFRATNGGSQLIKDDIFAILSVLEFMNKPGQVLSNIFNVTRTTISRIKNKKSHIFIINEYENLDINSRKKIYKDFCDIYNLLEVKANTTILKGKRKLSREQVLYLLYNEEKKRPISLERLTKIFNIKSENTLRTIIDGLSYKDYSIEYKKLTLEQKNEIASLFSNE